MSDAQFKATVIVPVYNVKKYLSTCFDSLVNQTIGFNNMEVVFVNDGSTDGGEEICKEFADKYDNVFLYSKENGGLSSTRNYGLAHSHGKYIFFLDSDDRFRNDTVKAVTDFFDTVYDTVDLVTFRIIQYYNNEPVIVHYRYRTLTETGVYDLWDPNNRFISQTNINICIKNRGENNPVFDTTKGFRHEDEKFCCEVIKEKMKIGFCDKGEYCYNRDNMDSIVSTLFSPENIFESSMKYYEKLFESFGSVVPTYFQGFVFNDLQWKLRDKKLLPTHLDGNEWLKANERIDNLLSKIDEDTIVLHPAVSENYRYYWLMRRPNSHPIVTDESGFLCIFSDGRKLYETKKIKLQKADNGYRLISPVFFFLNPNQFRLVCNGKEIELNKSKDLRSTDILDILPCFKKEISPDDKIIIVINSKAYNCTI